MQKIISILKDSNLTGRSGSAFPVWKKWKAVKEAKGKIKYVVCNAAEGEKGSFKDGFLLEKYPKEVIEGIKIAQNFLKNAPAFIYLKKEYYDKFSDNLESLSKGLNIILIKKPDKYIAGEETAICQAIEGKEAEPRVKPPFITEKGIFQKPTLINNVETFYFISKIFKKEYKNTRFYSISGDIKNPGVCEFPEKMNMSDVLKESFNYPLEDFFIKAGGGICGKIYLKEELEQPLCGLGSIIVYDKKKTDPLALMIKWAEFLSKGNCDKCVPCREGLYRLKESLAENKINKELLKDLFFVLENTSFCSLGKSVPCVFRDAINKLTDENI